MSTPPRETCYVIGSNSFSGASFVAYLLEKGYPVIGSSRSSLPHKAFLPHTWMLQPQNFTFHQFDLNHDLDATMDMVNRERPAYVINFAAQSMVGESWKNPDHWFMTNAVSTVRLHDRLRKCEFLKKYVHITTPEVYGSTSGFIDENAPFNPSTPYAVSRAAGDMSLRSFFGAYKFPVVYTRAANVFGPAQQLYRIIPRAAIYIRLGKKIQLHGGGYSERSFIHIRDVSDATERVMRDGVPGEAYHISTNRIISIRDLVRMTCDKMGVKFEDCVEEVGERLGKDAFYTLSSEKIRKQLGWQDHIALEQGIDETIAWIDRFLPDLKQLPFDYIHKP